MSFEKIKPFMPYALMVLAVAVVYWLRQFAPAFVHAMHQGTEAHITPYVSSLGVIAVIVMAGVLLVRKTFIPKEMLFLVFGIYLAPFMESLREVASGVLIYLAANVLVKAGLGVKISEFWKTLTVTSCLSLVSLLLTAFLFSAGQYYVIGPLLGMTVSAASANLTGALLASTDPAALLPVMLGLYWLVPRAKDIVLTESGLTDVTGALLVALFIPLALAGTMVRVWGSDGYGAVFSFKAVSFLGVQVGWAIVGAVVGALVLYVLQALREWNAHGDDASMRDILMLKRGSKPKDGEHLEGEDETVWDIWAFVLAFVVAFCLTSWLGGNVFLACFGAGLLLSVEKHIEHGQHVYDEKIERLYIPPIFVLGGVLVEWASFWESWKFGLLSAALLIIVRYVAVFAGLAIPMFFKQVTLNEAKYFASVRQVGAIGIVLAVSITAKKIPGTELVLATTAWVAGVTLGFCGWWSKRQAISLGLAREK